MRQGCSNTTIKGIRGLTALFGATLALTTGAVQAQSDAAPPSYQVSDAAGAAQNGPVRLARFSYVQGQVAWRPGENADWSPAAINLPIRQGAQIWVTAGRAEVQFDDGSLVRLGPGAVVTLQTLYSDADGEFTELRINQGLASLRLRHARSVFQTDAPNVSVKAAGPAKIRLGVNSGTEVPVRQGRATVEGPGGSTALRTGEYLDVTDPGAAFSVTGLPPADGWDRFNDDRDRRMDEAIHEANRVPSSIGLVAGDLDEYGDWRGDALYGTVWVPRVVGVGWRPYHDGHWVWVDPFGWTWVSSEAWGWAPYHYGTWVSEPYGWAWVPGPAVQYWSPAVVHFCSYGGQVAWAPLAPVEVRYPPRLAIGYRGGDWSLSFSIGGAAVYAPGGPAWFEPRPWRNVVINRVTNVTNVTNIYNVNAPVTVNRYDRIVPINARLADGVSTVGREGFAGSARFAAVDRASAPNLFAHGQAVLAAAPGQQPLAGPAMVRPTAASRTPSRSFLDGGAAPRAALARPVFRSAVAPRVARQSVPSGTFVGHAGPPVNRVAPAPQIRQSALEAQRRAHSTPPIRPVPLPAAQAAARARRDIRTQPAQARVNEPARIAPLVIGPSPRQKVPHILRPASGSPNGKLRPSQPQKRAHPVASHASHARPMPTAPRH